MIPQPPAPAHSPLRGKRQLAAVAGLASGLCALTLAALPARATAGFSYQWSSPRVRVTWSEGNATPELPAIRRQVGHWKRLAETLWTEQASAPPLEMTVSLYGPDLGSDGPKVELRAGTRTERVPTPITDEGVFTAILKARDGSPAPATGPASADAEAPADDTEARLSPDGQWLATVSWRGHGPEVWVTRRDSSAATRVAFPETLPLLDRLILTEPRWSVDGARLAWIQGGRVVLYEPARGAARLATPPKRRAVGIDWSPHPLSPLLVRYEDDSFSLLDISAGTEIPLSELLKDAAPMGEFFWSPLGQRLLFRTQGRIITAALTGPAQVAAMLERLLTRMTSAAPPPPESQLGENEERIAVLDLAQRRLDAYPVRNTVLDGAEIRSVNWAPEGDRVFVVAGLPGAPGSELVRLPLQRDAKTVKLMETTVPLAAVGAREGTDEGEGVRYAYVHGEELVVVEDSEPPVVLRPYPPTTYQSFQLPPGPHGGYRGVEGEEITEDETGVRVVVESGAQTGGVGARHAFPGGFLAVAPVDAARPPLRQTAQSRGAVDIDVRAVSDGRVAAIVTSPGGGVGEILLASPDPADPARWREEAVSARLTGMTPAVVAATDQPFGATDVATGAGAIAAQYGRPGRAPWVPAAVGAVLALLAVVFFLRRRQRRP